MKLTAALLLVLCLQVSAKVSSQTITYTGKNVSLDKIFIVIEEQTGFLIAANAQLVKSAKPVTIDVVDLSLQKFLDKIFEEQELQFSIRNKTIFLSKKIRSTVPVENTPAIHTRSLIKGIVCDNNGKALEGASVVTKGSAKNTLSDGNGQFYVNVQAGDIIQISFVGFETISIRITEKMLEQGSAGVIRIAPKITEMDESVVVAYGRTTQRANTGAVTVVKGEQIQTLPNRSFDKSLQGLVPGLQVTNGTGQPGGGLSGFTVRGIATGGDADPSTGIGASVRNPLIVIDGVPVSQEPMQIRLSSTTPISNAMAQLNPSDIETISVLKDASAIALYGSKASNGVILITTKKGRSGKTIFNFRHQTDLAEMLNKKLNVLNQQQYKDLLYDTYRNTPATPVWTDELIEKNLKEKFPVRSNGEFYFESNWSSALYNNRAVTNSDELSISGGNEKNNFYLNLENTVQQGVVRHTGFNRKSITLNYENRSAAWMKLGTNISLSYSTQDYAGISADLVTAYHISPLNPVYDEKGNYIYNYNWGLITSGGTPLPNQAAGLELNTNRNTNYRALTRLFAEVRPLQWLSFNANVGIDYSMTEAKEKIDSRLTSYDGLEAGIGRIDERDMRNFNLISTNTIRIDKQFGRNHHLGFLLGQEAQIQNSKFLYVTRRKLTDPVIDQLMGANELANANGNSGKQTLLSYFGQANYGYLNRYFTSLTVRRDGSSLFGENERFGNYWSVGAGWIISDEPWIAALKKQLNYLKLRASLGESGNSIAIGKYAKYDPMEILPYIDGSALVPSSTIGNPSIKWEHTFSWNIGVDMRLFNNRIFITADLYKRKTNDLISLIGLASNTGNTYLNANIGDMENKGLELTVSGDVLNIGAFKWNMNANWSSNKNILLKSYFEDIGPLLSSITANAVGENFNSFYLRKWAGVNPDNGAPLWLDENGKPTENYNNAPRVFTGKPQPDGFGSVTSNFSWKGVELSAMFYYQYGFELYGNSLASLINDGDNPLMNQSVAALNYWKKPGDIAPNPRRRVNNPDRGTDASTRYLFKGDYIRLRNLSLAWSVPAQFLNKYHLKQLKLYVQAGNLITWSIYKDADPDGISFRGYSELNYPQQKTFSLGLNLQF